MNNSSVSYLRKPLALLGAGLSLFAAQAAFAQQTAAATSTTDDTLKLDKYVVTGSYLPPAADATAVPVITVDANAIQNSGNNTSVLEILRKTVPQFTGNGNIGTNNANVGSGNTQGGSSLSLRNTSTLVLINGRRAAYSPTSASGGAQFVDVSLIPVAAIEKIEVLADGASAIYGTDAVAGVVNIILKTDFQGFEAGVRYGWSSNTGHYENKSAYIVGGVSSGKTSITISSEYSKYTPIMNWQRPYSAVTYGTPTFPGSVNIGGSYYYLDPSITTPTVAPGGTSAAGLVAAGTYSGPRSAGAQFTLFNLSQYVTQTFGGDRKSLTMAFDHEISDYLKVFGDFMFANTRTHSQINGQPINAQQAMKDIFNATGGAMGSTSGNVPAGQFGNPFNVAVNARNRLVTHPREYNNDDTSYRGVVGLLGKIADSGWTWEAAADYNHVLENYANPGVINQPHLSNATLVGDFNFFSRTPISAAAQLADQVVGTATGTFISTLKNFDFKVRGKLFDLPGGPVDMALGGEIRRENLSGIADPLSVIDPVTGALGWSGATTFYPFNASRQVKSEFAEVRLPLAKDLPAAHLLEVTGAVRHEAYSDTSSPTVPKISFRYLPVNDELAFRGTYSKSFSAPQLYSLFGPGGIGFTSPFTLTTSSGGSVANFQTNAQSGSNPNLKPSTSKNYSFGVVYSPKALKGFSVSVDYWHIKQVDLVSTVGSANILNSVEALGAASPYITAVGLGSFTGPHPTAPGQISSGVPDNIYVTDTLVNIASQELAGIDATIKYTWNSDQIGRFDFASNIGYYSTYKTKTLPDIAAEEDAGHSSSLNGTIPRWLAYSSVAYSRGKYGAYLAWQHIPGVNDLNDGSNTSSFDSFDLSASYTFGSEVKYLSGAKLTLGVNNVFNKFGPLDPAVWTDSNVDVGTYGAVGRMFFADIKIKF
jgi:iron complex outermembrane receptor protein